VVLSCSCRPLQSLSNRRLLSAHAAPLPWSSPGDGLGTLTTIARRCSLCLVSRSGSPGLSRILPGLAFGSVSRPERTFEVFRSTSPTNPALLQNQPSTLSSALLRSTRLLPGSAHADLLSWGWTRTEGHPCRLCPSPLRRPSFRTPLSRSPRASTPGRGLTPSSFGFGMPLPKSRSVLVVSHHLDGFLRAWLAGLLHPAADPGVRLVSCRPKPRIPRDATTPRRTPPTRRGHSGHPAPWPP